MPYQLQRRMVSIVLSGLVLGGMLSAADPAPKIVKIKVQVDSEAAGSEGMRQWH